MRPAPRLDLAARGGKKLESIPDAIMGEVLARIAAIFDLAIRVQNIWSAAVR